jgi:hypothetical protein
MSCSDVHITAATACPQSLPPSEISILPGHATSLSRATKDCPENSTSWCCPRQYSTKLKGPCSLALRHTFAVDSEFWTLPAKSYLLAASAAPCKQTAASPSSCMSGSPLSHAWCCILIRLATSVLPLSSLQEGNTHRHNLPVGT